MFIFETNYYHNLCDLVIFYGSLCHLHQKMLCLHILEIINLAPNESILFFSLAQVPIFIYFWFFPMLRLFPQKELALQQFKG